MKRTHETGRMKVAAARLIAVLSTALLLLAPLPARCQEERRPPKPPKPPRPEDAVAAFIQFGDSFRDSVEEEKERLATKTGSGGDSEYTQFKRWEWITGQRLGPDEEVVNVAYKTRYECNRYAASETLQEIRAKTRQLRLFGSYPAEERP